jgi:hypothetical protein
MSSLLRKFLLANGLRAPGALVHRYPVGPGTVPTLDQGLPRRGRSGRSEDHKLVRTDAMKDRIQRAAHRRASRLAAGLGGRARETHRKLTQ